MTKHIIRDYNLQLMNSPDADEETKVYRPVCDGLIAPEDIEGLIDRIKGLHNEGMIPIVTVFEPRRK